MRLNRRMQGYLDEIRRRDINAEALAPHGGRALASAEVLEAGDCFVLREFLARPPPISIPDFPDRTTFECAANKLRLSTFLNERLVRACPLLLLVGGLLVAESLVQELQQFEQRFHVIVSYDGDDCVVRFHKIRNGERWLFDDLERYADEGVLALEVGPGA